MALLAEELVEEWVRREGFFTIRGIRLGVQEIDLLALNADGVARHIEVQASMRPMNYVAPLTRAVMEARGVRSPRAAIGRSPEEMRICADAWVQGKFHHVRKEALRNALVPGVPWSFELVLGEALHEEEVVILGDHVHRLHRLSTVVEALRGRDNKAVPATAGADFVDLLRL